MTHLAYDPASGWQRISAAEYRLQLRLAAARPDGHPLAHPPHRHRTRAVDAGEVEHTPAGINVVRKGRVVSRWKPWMESLPRGGFRPHCDRIV